MAGFGDALKLWGTNVRLFTAAGGTAPEGDAKRLAFIKILPPAVAAHVTLHDEIFQDFEKLKRFAIKYVKVNTGLDAQRGRPVKLLERDDFNNQRAPGSWEGESSGEDRSEVDAFEDGPDAVTIPCFDDRRSLNRSRSLPSCAPRVSRRQVEGQPAGLCVSQGAVARAVHLQEVEARGKGERHATCHRATART